MFNFFKRKATPAKTSSKPVQGKPIGTVTHYYSNLGVAIVKFKQEVQAGTALRFKGVTTDFEEKADSLQQDHKEVEKAPKGKEIGVKVGEKVREGDEVYLA